MFKSLQIDQLLKSTTKLGHYRPGHYSDFILAILILSLLPSLFYLQLRTCFIVILK